MKDEQRSETSRVPKQQLFGCERRAYSIWADVVLLGQIDHLGSRLGLHLWTCEREHSCGSSRRRENDDQRNGITSQQPHLLPHRRPTHTAYPPIRSSALAQASFPNAGLAESQRRTAVAAALTISAVFGRRCSIDSTSATRTQCGVPSSDAAIEPV